MSAMKLRAVVIISDSNGTEIERLIEPARRNGRGNYSQQFLPMVEKTGRYLAKHWMEKAPAKEWPLTAHAYLSPDADGHSRQGSAAYTFGVKAI